MRRIFFTLFSLIALTCSAQVEVTCPDCGHKLIVNITANGVSVQSADDSQVSGLVGQQTSSQTSNKGEYGQCKATTKKGTQCSRKAVDSSGYCTQHKNIANKSTSSEISSLKSSTNSSSSSSGGRCKAKTKSGKQCSRAARSNGYCWQHGG